MWNMIYGGDLDRGDRHVGKFDPNRPRRIEWVNRRVILGAFSFLSATLYAVNVVLSGLISYYIYVVNILGSESEAEWYLAAIILGVLINHFWVTASKCHLFFDRDYSIFRRPRRKILYRLFASWTITLFIILEIGFLVKISDNYSRVWLCAWFVTVVVGFTVIELALRLLGSYLLKSGWIREFVIVVGGESDYRDIVDTLVTAPYSQQYTLVVGVTPVTTEIDQDGPDVTSVLTYAKNNPVDHILISASCINNQGMKVIVDALKEICADISVVIVNELPIRGVQQVGDLALLRLVDKPLRDWSWCVKWIEDKLVCFILLVFLSPLMSLIALAIWFETGLPIFFRQPRFGFKGKPFIALKFRTMFQERGDPSGTCRTRRDDPRVTRVGKLLRRTSLDEIPQLINVLCGDMSLVGPRAHPLGMMVGDRYYFEAIRSYTWRHRVKPGITGWAQVNGYRGEIDTIEKARKRLAYDLYYIESWTVWLDLRIIFKTIRILIGKDVF